VRSRPPLVSPGASNGKCPNATFSRRYATPRADWRRHRGLKPTATAISSLRDGVRTPQTQPKISRLRNVRAFEA